MITWQRQSTGISQQKRLAWSNKWRYHVLESVLENSNNYRRFWDFIVWTDKEIQATRPALDNNHWQEGEKLPNYRCTVAIQENCGVRAEADEKVEKYKYLAREVQGMWAVSRKHLGVDTSIIALI